MHFAARDCGGNGSSVLEYLVKSGADIYSADCEGFPPYCYLSRHGSDNAKEQEERHLIVGYKVFVSHRDWIPSCPTAALPISDRADAFPMFNDYPEEIVYSVLYEMWPPWKEISSADRIDNLFPKFDDANRLIINPLCIRACLSREYIQQTFANWLPIGISKTKSS